MWFICSYFDAINYFLACSILFSQHISPFILLITTPSPFSQQIPLLSQHPCFSTIQHAYFFFIGFYQGIIGLVYVEWSECSAAEKNRMMEVGEGGVVDNVRECGWCCGDGVMG